MRRHLKTSFLVLFFALLSLAPANIEMAVHQPRDYNYTLKKIMSQMLARLPEVAGRKPYRLKKFNASLQSMGEAAMLIAHGEDLRLADSYLDEALKHYDGNSLAIFLKAVLADESSNETKADTLFETFLLKSRNFTDFEKAFLRWDEFHKLRRSVYDMLGGRGIDFKGREDQIRVQEPVKTLARYLMHPAPEDKFFNLTFVIITIGGGVLLLLALLILGIDFSAPPMKVLVALYFVFWLCYGIWLWDIAIGLPFHASRFTLIPWLLCGATALFVGIEVFTFWRERNAPPDPGHRRCRKCYRQFPTLMLECPHCHTRYEETP